MKFNSSFLRVTASFICFTLLFTSTLAYSDSALIGESLKKNSAFHLNPRALLNLTAGSRHLPALAQGRFDFVVKKSQPISKLRSAQKSELRSAPDSHPTGPGIIQTRRYDLHFLKFQDRIEKIGDFFLKKIGPEFFPRAAQEYPAEFLKDIDPEVVGDIFLKINFIARRGWHPPLNQPRFSGLAYSDFRLMLIGIKESLSVYNYVPEIRENLRAVDSQLKLLDQILLEVKTLDVEKLLESFIQYQKQNSEPATPEQLKRLNGLKIAFSALQFDHSYFLHDVLSGGVRSPSVLYRILSFNVLEIPKRYPSVKRIKMERFGNKVRISYRDGDAQPVSEIEDNEITPGGARAAQLFLLLRILAGFDIFDLERNQENEFTILHENEDLYDLQVESDSELPRKGDDLLLIDVDRDEADDGFSIGGSDDDEGLYSELRAAENGNLKVSFLKQALLVAAGLGIGIAANLSSVWIEGSALSHFQKRSIQFALFTAALSVITFSANLLMQFSKTNKVKLGEAAKFMQVEVIVQSPWFLIKPAIKHFFTNIIANPWVASPVMVVADLFLAVPTFLFYFVTRKFTYQHTWQQFMDEMRHKFLPTYLSHMAIWGSVNLVLYALPVRFSYLLMTISAVVFFVVSFVRLTVLGTAESGTPGSKVFPPVPPRAELRTDVFTSSTESFSEKQAIDMRAVENLLKTQHGFHLISFAPEEDGFYFDASLEAHSRFSPTEKRNEDVVLLSGPPAEGSPVGTVFFRLGDYAIADIRLKSLIPLSLNDKVIYVNDLMKQFWYTKTMLNYTLPFLAQLYRDRDIIRDQTVLELGAGSGIASLFALRLGARKTVSVERHEYLEKDFLSDLESNGFSKDRAVFLSHYFTNKKIPEILKAHGPFQVVLANIGPHETYRNANMQALELIKTLQNESVVNEFTYIGGGFGYSFKSHEPGTVESRFAFKPSAELDFLRTHFGFNQKPVYTFYRAHDYLKALDSFTIFASFSARIPYQRAEPGSPRSESRAASALPLDAAKSELRHIINFQPAIHQISQVSLAKIGRAAPLASDLNLIAKETVGPSDASAKPSARAELRKRGVPFQYPTKASVYGELKVRRQKGWKNHARELTRGKHRDRALYNAAKRFEIKLPQAPSSFKYPTKTSARKTLSARRKKGWENHIDALLYGKHRDRALADAVERLEIELPKEPRADRAELRVKNIFEGSVNIGTHRDVEEYEGRQIELIIAPIEKLSDAHIEQLNQFFQTQIPKGDYTYITAWDPSQKTGGTFNKIFMIARMVEVGGDLGEIEHTDISNRYLRDQLKKLGNSGRIVEFFSVPYADSDSKALHVSEILIQKLVEQYFHEPVKGGSPEDAPQPEHGEPVIWLPVYLKRMYKDAAIEVKQEWADSSKQVLSVSLRIVNPEPDESNPRAELRSKVIPIQDSKTLKQALDSILTRGIQIKRVKIDNGGGRLRAVEFTNTDHLLKAVAPNVHLKKGFKVHVEFTSNQKSELRQSGWAGAATAALPAALLSELRNENGQIIEFERRLLDPYTRFEKDDENKLLEIREKDSVQFSSLMMRFLFSLNQESVWDRKEILRRKYRAIQSIFSRRSELRSLSWNLSRPRVQAALISAIAIAAAVGGCSKLEWLMNETGRPNAPSQAVRTLPDEHLIPADLLAEFHSDDNKRIAAALQAIYERQVPVTLNFLKPHFKRKNGEIDPIIIQIIESQNIPVSSEILLQVKIRKIPVSFNFLQPFFEQSASLVNQLTALKIILDQKIPVSPNFLLSRLDSEKDEKLIIEYLKVAEAQKIQISKDILLALLWKKDDDITAVALAAAKAQGTQLTFEDLSKLLTETPKPRNDLFEIFNLSKYLGSQYDSILSAEMLSRLNASHAGVRANGFASIDDFSEIGVPVFHLVQRHFPLLRFMSAEGQLRFARKAAVLVADARKQAITENKMVLGSGTQLVIASHESNQFDRDRLVKVARSFGVENIVHFNRSETGATEKSVKDGLLKQLQTVSYEKQASTVWLVGHGWSTHFWFSDGEPGVAVPEDLKTKWAVSYKELAEALVEGQDDQTELDFSHLILILDQCYSYDFAMQILNDEIIRVAMAKQKKIKALPIVIPVGNKGRIAYINRFILVLDEFTRAGEGILPLSLKDVIESIDAIVNGKNTGNFGPQDPAVLVPIDPELVRKQLGLPKDESVEPFLEIARGNAASETVQYRAELRTDISKVEPLAYAEFEKALINHGQLKEKYYKLHPAQRSRERSDAFDSAKSQSRHKIQDQTPEHLQQLVREFIVKSKFTADQKAKILRDFFDGNSNHDTFFGKYLLPVLLNDFKSSEEEKTVIDVAAVYFNENFLYSEVKWALHAALHNNPTIHRQYKLVQILLRYGSQTSSYLKEILSIFSAIPTASLTASAFTLATHMLFTGESEVHSRYQKTSTADDRILEMMEPNKRIIYYYLLKIHEASRKSGGLSGDSKHQIINLSRLLDNGADYPGAHGHDWFSSLREGIHSRLSRFDLEHVRKVLHYWINLDAAVLKDAGWTLIRDTEENLGERNKIYSDIINRLISNLISQGKITSRDPEIILNELLKIPEKELLDVLSKANPEVREYDFEKVRYMIELYLALADHYAVRWSSIIPFLTGDHPSEFVAQNNKIRLESVTNFMRDDYQKMLQVIQSQNDAAALSAISKVQNDIKEFFLLGEDVRKKLRQSLDHEDEKESNAYLDGLDEADREIEKDIDQLYVEEVYESDMAMLFEINHKLSILAQEKITLIQTQFEKIGSLEELKNLIPALIAVGKFIQASGLGGVDFDHLLNEMEAGDIKFSQLHDLVRTLQAEIHKITRQLNDTMRSATQYIPKEGTEQYDFEKVWQEHTSLFDNKPEKIGDETYDKYTLSSEGKEKLQGVLIDELIRGSGISAFDRTLMRSDEILSSTLKSESDGFVRQSTLTPTPLPQGEGRVRDLEQHFYRFGKDVTEKREDLLSLWSKKGLNLVKMIREGIPVPPGVILSAKLVTQPEIFRSVPFKKKIEAEIERLKRYSQYPDLKLILYARSGSAFMLPGLLATISNVGMNDVEAEALAAKTGDVWFAYDTYAEFIRSFSINVLGILEAEFEQVLNVKEKEKLSDNDMKAVVGQYKQIVARYGKSIPDAMMDQVMMAVEAVYASWDSKDARAYRERHKISQEWGTVVILQKGVFGNLKPTEDGKISGAGHGVLRVMPDGREIMQGKFRFHSIGDQLMSRAEQNYILISNSERVRPDEQTFEDLQPELYAQLFEYARKLKEIFRYNQQFEFTIERGQIWLVQSNDDFLVDQYPEFTDSSENQPIARGHGVSGGAVRGLVANSFKVASELLEKLKKEPMSDVDGVILFLDRVNPELVNKIPKGVHIIAKIISVHAETLAQKEGISAVYGIPDMVFNGDKKIWSIAGHELPDGTVISIDGHENPLLYHQSGNVYLGSAPLQSSRLDIVAETAISEPVRAEVLLRQRAYQLLEEIFESLRNTMRSSGILKQDKSWEYLAHLMYSSLNHVLNTIHPSSNILLNVERSEQVLHQLDNLSHWFKLFSGQNDQEIQEWASNAAQGRDFTEQGVAKFIQNGGLTGDFRTQFAVVRDVFQSREKELRDIIKSLSESNNSTSKSELRAGENQKLQSPRRILIVEDEKDLVELYQFQLGRLFHLVPELIGGTDTASGALEYASAHDDLDLIILDNKLRGKTTGLSILGELKKIRPGALIVFNSAKTELPEEYARPGTGIIDSPSGKITNSKSFFSSLYDLDQSRAELRKQGGLQAGPRGKTLDSNLPMRDSWLGMVTRMTSLIVTNSASTAESRSLTSAMSSRSGTTTSRTTLNLDSKFSISAPTSVGVKLRSTISHSPFEFARERSHFIAEDLAVVNIKNDEIKYADSGIEFKEMQIDESLGKNMKPAKIQASVEKMIKSPGIQNQLISSSEGTRVEAKLDGHPVVFEIEKRDESKPGVLKVTVKFRVIASRKVPIEAERTVTAEETVLYGTLEITKTISLETLQKLRKLIAESIYAKPNISESELRILIRRVAGLDSIDASAKVGLAISNLAITNSNDQNNMGDTLALVAHYGGFPVGALTPDLITANIVDAANQVLPDEEDISMANTWAGLKLKLEGRGVGYFRVLIPDSEKGSEAFLLNQYGFDSVGTANNVPEFLSVAGITATARHAFLSELRVLESA